MYKNKFLIPNSIMANTLMLFVFLVKSSQQSTCFLSNSFQIIHENINIAFLRDINSKIEQNALAFIHTASENFNLNTTTKHAYHFHNILKDVNTINKKLDRINNLSKNTDHALKTDKIVKRSTILNLGILAPYLGIASIDNLSDIHKALYTLEKDIKNSNLKLSDRLNHIDKSLTLISKVHDLENEENLKTTHLIFFYLKIQHITLNLLQEICDIEVSIGLWNLGLPTNILFDFKQLDILKKNITANVFPLFSQTNFTLIPPSLLQVEVNNNTISHSISIPLISPDHICECGNSTTFKCGQFLTNYNTHDCTKINSNSFFCNTRPCLYKNFKNITCHHLDNNQLFVLEPQIQESCSISYGPSIINQFILQKNISKVILLGQNKSLICNSYKINANLNQESSLMADLIFDLKNFRDELNKSDYSNSTNLLKKIKNYIAQNSTALATNSQTDQIPYSILNHPNMMLSNTTVTLIICLLIIIWAIKKVLSYHKKSKDSEF